jgi:hypothetical protein
MHGYIVHERILIPDKGRNSFLPHNVYTASEAARALEEEGTTHV